MSHMVIFRDVEGRPGYHQAEDLDGAVRFVEELRNERQVTDARVFSMQEVPLEFKTYWKVEVTAGEPAAMAPPAPAAAPAFEPAAPPALVAEPFMASLEVADPIEPEPEPEPERQPLSFVSGESSPSHGRFGLFGRS